MSVSEAFRGVVDESVESMELAPGANGFHLEPRCRICRNDQVRTKVNDLLAIGASYAMVLRALGDDNATLEQRDQVTIDSVRNHCMRHFPVQQVARATYRDILERRAKENSVDFINGVATAITPMALLETVMVKGYQTLVDELTTVSYRDGMEAALKLNEALRKDEGTHERAQSSMLGRAPRSSTPRSQEAVSRRVNGFLLLAVLDEMRGTVTHPEYDEQNVIAA